MVKPMIEDSNHNLASKYSVINTLTHRAKAQCSTPESIKQELEHLEKVLIGCKYPRWEIKKILQKQVHSQGKTNQEETTSINTEENMPHGNSIFQRNWWKLSKTFAKNMEYRDISREEKQLKTY